MSSVVIYQNTEEQCFCQIKFDSGERVLISIASTPVPSTKVVRMTLRGLVPRETIWKYTAVMAGSGADYAQNLMTMFNRGTVNHPLDDIKDALLQCRSIDECRRLLASRLERLGGEAPDILTLYGDLLQDGAVLKPESSLPAPKAEIKEALINEARRLSPEADLDALETLRTYYSLPVPGARRSFRTLDLGITNGT